MLRNCATEEQGSCFASGVHFSNPFRSVFPIHSYRKKPHKLLSEMHPQFIQWCTCFMYAYFMMYILMVVFPHTIFLNYVIGLEYRYICVELSVNFLHLFTELFDKYFLSLFGINCSSVLLVITAQNSHFPPGNHHASNP